jgi:hypothetical protein
VKTKMARFNATSKGSMKTENYEGDIAYKMSPKLELYATTCCASLQNKFYEEASDTIERLRSLVGKVPPEFVAKLAVYTREQMYLRSVPLVLAVEMAKKHKGKLIGDMVSRIIQRADEITEILGYYQEANKREGDKKLNKLSKQIQKGIARAFNKFDGYQFAKYNRAGAIKLRDALFLSHAKPKDKEQEALFKKIVDDNLDIPYTWEVELSTAKEKGKTKKQVWEQLIDSKKVGYMALLRNLRNILSEDVSVLHIKKVADYIASKEAVKKSKQLPFRFLSAYKMIQGNKSVNTGLFLEALEKAVKHSAENISGFDENTSVLVACDVSGSMTMSMGRRGITQYYDIGLVLGMLLQSRCKKTITGIFGTDWKVKHLPKDSILQNVESLDTLSNEVGWSTNGYKILDYVVKNKVMVDKLMVFTDMELWNDDSDFLYEGERGLMPKLWNQYKKINPTAKLYLFDLAGYGETPLRVEGDVYFIAGWSDKIFNILEAIDKGSSAVKEIEKLEI